MECPVYLVKMMHHLNLPHVGREGVESAQIQPNRFLATPHSNEILGGQPLPTRRNAHKLQDITYDATSPIPLGPTDVP